MKYKDYPIPHRLDGFIDSYNLYRIINRCEANIIVTTSHSYLTHGNLLYPYERLKVVDIKINESLEHNTWYLLKDDIPVGKVIFR